MKGKDKAARALISSVPLVFGLALSGCSSTGSRGASDDMQIAEDAQFQRYAPRYPIEEASAGRGGCASVRYLVMPDNQVAQVEVVEATSRHFARASVASVQSWEWKHLPEGTINEPTWLLTRFEFCLESGNGNCDLEQLQQRAVCSGDDVISAIGYRVR